MQPVSSCVAAYFDVQVHDYSCSLSREGCGSAFALRWVALVYSLRLMRPQRSQKK
jgi:hypothetical protein